MQYHHSGDAPVYAPNSYGRAYQDVEGPVDNGWEADGEMVRAAYSLHVEDDDWGQAHALVREVYNDEQRARLVNTIAGQLPECEEPVLGRVIQYWKDIDAEVGAAIEAAYLANT